MITQKWTDQQLNASSHVDNGHFFPPSTSSHHDNSQTGLYYQFSIEVNIGNF